MNISDKISFVLQILTLIAASYIGIVQTGINDRQVMLQDYVAVAAFPDQSGQFITLLNTGTVNLYIHKILINDEVTEYERPRLLAVGTLESSYYWVRPPENLEVNQDFEVKLYVTDQFGQTWLSEHGGHFYENKQLGLWSYQTEKIK